MARTKAARPRSQEEEDASLVPAPTAEDEAVNVEQKRIFSEHIKAALENARGNAAFISREKFDRIVYVLANWDAFTGSARRRVQGRL
ncbi:MAG: hypothetical protein SGPRY_009112 [Prymnesium sp.]